MHFEEISTANHGEVTDLILAGLREHWGTIDASLNTDLIDMICSYREGRTVLIRDDDGSVVDGSVIATGTVVKRCAGVAEIVRMSVASNCRRRGLGRQILDELLATARRWGTKTVILETTSSWTDVVAFYENNGFSITSIEDGEFGSDTWFELRLDT